jgi:hypothetical protein
MLYARAPSQGRKGNGTQVLSYQASSFALLEQPSLPVHRIRLPVRGGRCDVGCLGLCPSDHLKRSVSLTCLAIRLSDRYGQLGAMGDLEEAIVLDREALDLCPQEHPGRPMSSTNFTIQRIIGCDLKNPGIYVCLCMSYDCRRRRASG